MPRCRHQPSEAGVDELTAIVTVPLAQGEGQPLVEVLDGAGDAPVVQVPEGLQFGPAGGHVDGDQRGAVPAGRGLPAMQDQIALQRARRDAGPFAPRAQRHLGAQGVRAGASRRGWRGRRRRRGRSSRSRVAALARVSAARTVGGDAQAMAGGQGREQRGEDGAQQLAGELVAGQPGRLEDGGQFVGNILHRAAGGGARGPGGRRSRRMAAFR